MTIKKAAFIISLVLFGLSIAFPAFHTAGNAPEAGQSLMLVLLGWLGALLGGAGLCWLANPLLFLSWSYISKKPGAAIFTSFFAAVFALLFLAFDSMMVNEAGSYSIITERNAGYWLWLASILFFFIAAIVIYVMDNKLRLGSSGSMAGKKARQ